MSSRVVLCRRHHTLLTVLPVAQQSPEVVVPASVHRVETCLRGSLTVNVTLVWFHVPTFIVVFIEVVDDLKILAGEGQKVVVGVVDEGGHESHTGLEVPGPVDVTDLKKDTLTFAALCLGVVVTETVISPVLVRDQTEPQSMSVRDKDLQETVVDTGVLDVFGLGPVILKDVLCLKMSPLRGVVFIF